MYVKWVYLCVILLESLYMTSAGHCDAERVKRASEDATETLKFYIECPAVVDEPMVAMASDNQQVEEESPLAKQFRSPEKNRPLIKKPLFSKNPISLEKFRSSDLLQNIRNVDLKKSQPLRNLLNNGLNNNVFPPLNNLPNNPSDLTLNTNRFQNGFLKPLPQIPKPSLENLKTPRNPLTNDFLNLPQRQNILNNPLDLMRNSNQLNANFLKPLPEVSETALDDLKTQQNRLVNGFPELPQRQNTLDKSTQVQNDIKNILDKSQPQGRFTNILKDFIVARKKENLRPSSSDVVRNEEPEPIEEIPLNEEVFQEPTLAEKIKILAEQKRQQLAETIASAKNRLSELKTNTMRDSNPENSIDFVARSLPSMEEMPQNDEMLQGPTLAEKIKILAEQRRQQLADTIASAKNRLSELKTNTMKDSNPENSIDFVARSLPSMEEMRQGDEMLQGPTLAEKIKILAEQRRQQLADTIASAINRLSELKSNTMRDSNPENSNDFVAQSLQSMEDFRQNDETLQEPTLAEKIKILAEQRRQKFADTIASAKNRLSELKSNTMRDSNPENSNDFVAQSLPSMEDFRQNDETLQEPTLAEKIKILAEQRRQKFADTIASAKNRLSELKSNTMRDSNPENSNDFVAQSLPSMEDFRQNDEMLQEPTLAEKIKILAEQRRQQFADTIASAKNRLSELKSNTMRDSNPENSNDLVARSLPSVEDFRQNDGTLQEPTLAEKIQILAEQKRKALDDAIVSSRNKFLELRSNTMKVSEPENSNDIARSLPNENGINIHERSKLLRDKILERFRQNNGLKPPELTSFDRTNARESNLNSIPREPERNINKFEILAEKTKEIARKLKKFVDFDNEEERKAIKSIADPLNQRSNIASQPQELFNRNAAQEPSQVLLTDKLKNLMSQNPRTSNTPLFKRQKIDDNLRTSNSEQNLISDKISNPKVAMAERVQLIADKIRNALKPTGTNELRSSNERDSDVDNSNIDEVVEKVADKDMETENPDTIVKESPKDGVIDLNADSSKSANICKCIRVAFPEKFENGHFVMKSRNNDEIVSSASENESKSIIPVIPKIPASSPLGSKLRRVFNSRNSDQSTMADETRPVVAAPLESFRTELSDVDRAMMADQGIRSLLEFVKIVDQVDQYVSTKARKAIARLATVLTEDEDARIL